MIFFTDEQGSIILCSAADPSHYLGEMLPAKAMAQARGGVCLLYTSEPGNLSYLRPNFAKTVADVVESLGGKPFLTDCNTLYVGRRKNALDHMDAAYENGFSPFSTGCHVIIADGLKGTDEVEVPVQGGEYVKSAKIGRAVICLLYTSQWSPRRTVLFIRNISCRFLHVTHCHLLYSDTKIIFGKMSVNRSTLHIALFGKSRSVTS